MAQTAAEQGKRARELLLTAATQLIGDLGWTAVSTRLVAERAGVRPGVVHYHFPSMQALLREAAMSAIGQMVDAVGPMLRQAPSTTDGVDALLSMLDGFTGTDPESLLFSETYLAATRDEHLRVALGALVERFRADVSGWLHAHGHVDPDGTAVLLLAALDGFVLHKALNPGLSVETIRPAWHRLVATPGK
ncbi:TetR/AcrR family transcriptional regulator [Hamadaea sp. NPDC051192]|uniref:TetR/AcrR family transcriptional regulator n=1 Tax=Hamadaea sp. NPDC051192 TaxID=3154940 RepID=UPI00341DF24A